MSTKVTKVYWTIQTGHNWWSRSNAPVVLEIYRDNELLQRANLEPGRTLRLGKDSDAAYCWEFKNPDGPGVAFSGTALPCYKEFENGLSGHLKVKLIAEGDDAWEKVNIDSTIVSGDLQFIPGTIDSFAWQENYNRFYFGRDIMLSTDSSEGYTSLTLLY
ncbi:MAG TPA: hypothetical protein VE978_25750 [Chitinophagales bacterium]|nr:hypothetical protein [Chitinophagales bacterium]